MPRKAIKRDTDFFRAQIPDLEDRGCQSDFLS
jgi:hypothetical protein